MTLAGIPRLRRGPLPLGVQFGLLLVALLAVCGLLAFALYERAEHASADQALQRAMETLDPADAFPGFWVVVQADGEQEATGSLPEDLPLTNDLAGTGLDGETRQREVTLAGRDYFVRTEKRDGGVTQVAMDRTAQEQSAREIARSLLVAGFVGVVLAAGLAALLARRAMAPLVQALAVQRRFVADASHELRTPLTLLSTRVQMLRRRIHNGTAEGSEIQRDLDGVLADTRALADILEDLLVAADGGASAAYTDVDLVRVVRGVVDAAADDAEQRGLELGFITSAGPFHVHGSEAALRRAVLGLVDNAPGYAHTSVEIRLEALDHRLELIVSDDGPGIPADDAAHVFERFSSSRAHHTDRAGRRHYGLGLALVADIAEQHSGRVEVHNAVIGGTAFVMSLPRQHSIVRG